MKKILTAFLVCLSVFSVSAEEINWIEVLNYNHIQVIEKFGIPKSIKSYYGYETGISGIDHYDKEEFQIDAGSDIKFGYDGFEVYFITSDNVKGRGSLINSSDMYVSYIHITSVDKFNLPYNIQITDAFATIIGKLGTPSEFSSGVLEYAFPVKEDPLGKIWTNNSKNYICVDSTDYYEISLQEPENTIDYVDLYRHRIVTSKDW